MTDKTPLTPPNSAEMHFWRMDPAAWPKALAYLRALGFEWISTYLSWHSHAPQGPQADLEGAGDSALDLPAFLSLSQKLGFNVILKPGPWICAEEDQGGYPDWLLADPDYLMWDSADRPLLAGDVPQQHYVPCYLHPAYLEAVREWFHQVAEVIHPFCGPGGPVKILQLDNEPSAAFHMGVWEMDYNPCIVGSDGAYPRWLQKKYGSLEALRSVHGRAYPSVDAVQPPRSQDDLDPQNLRSGLDWTDFKSWYLGEHLRRLKAFWLTEGLPDVLFSINTIEGSPLGVPNDWRIFSTVADLAGLDYYAYLPFDESDLCRLVQGVNYSKAVFGRAWAPELMTGTWLLDGDPPELVGEAACSRHTRLMQLSAFAAGLDRANFYMTVNRDHWDHAPIDESGQPGTGYPFLKEVLDALSALPDLKDLQPFRHLAVLYDRHLARLAYLDPEDSLKGDLAAGYRRYEQLYRRLVGLGLNPALVDSEANLEELADYDLICLPGGRVHDRKVVKALRDYLHNGGKVLIFGPVPERDDRGNPVAPLEGAGMRQVPDDISRDELGGYLSESGLPSGWTCDTPGVFIFERRSDMTRVLFILNLNFERKMVWVRSPNGAGLILSPVFPRSCCGQAGGSRLRVELDGQGCAVFRILEDHL